MDALVTDALAWWTKARPDETALVDGDRALTYSELDAWTDSVAGALASDGVRSGDVVAVLAQSSLEWCVTAIATIKAGGVIAGYSTRFTDDELGELVRQTSPRLLFVDDGQQPEAEARLGVSVRSLAGVATMRHEQLRPPVVSAAPADPISIVFTSGSTGTPKGITFSHRAQLALMLEQLLREPIAPSDLRMLLVLPMYTNAGITHGLLMTLTRGGTFVLTPEFDAAESLELIVRHRITVMNGVPVVWERMAAVDGFEALDLSHLKMAMTGGARVSPEMLQAWHRRGVSLRQLYGMTEVGGVATLPTHDEAIRRPEGCGKGSPFTKIRIVDGAGQDCPPGVRGDVLITGPALMSGYWADPSATEEVMSGGWVRSGDIAVRDHDGTVVFADRAKDMVISGGFNISPMEIENAIAAIDGVIESAVISVADDRWGETPAAIIYSSAPLDTSGVVEQLNAVLADYKVPRYIVNVHDPLPRMPSGKVAKRQLAERYADLPRTASKVR